ncbi:MAG TPA: SCO family protein [Sphingomicrobium sp.]|nr:SCO family protein [Sphingomicrobium sp.]
MIWLLVALAAVGTVILTVYRQPEPAPTTATISGRSFGGPFTLVGSNGQPFASTQLAGKPYAIFFGFTHCPDVCPTTLARLARLRNQVGGAEAFNIVFVSVDPERDRPKEVAAYSNAFGSPVIGLTGTPEQLEKVKKQYGIFSEKVPQGDSYTMDHSAAVLLFDRDGQFRATISAEEQDGPALDKLKQLTA